MAKRRRSRSGGRSGYGGGQGGQGGRRRRYRRGGGGGGPVAAGAGAVDMEGEGMRPPEPEPEVSENGEPIPLEPGEGVLELHPNGYGFLRSPQSNYSRERTDPFVPATMIDRFRLREGVFVKAKVQQGRRQQGPRVREL
jgi:transcription termination factor Rho